MYINDGTAFEVATDYPGREVPLTPEIMVTLTLSLLIFLPGDQRPAVGIERIVDRPLARQLLVIIDVSQAKTFGDGLESGTFRRKVAGMSISSSDDVRQLQQSGIGQLVFADHRIEAALIAVMA